MTILIPEYLLSLLAIACVNVAMIFYLRERKKLHARALVLAVALFTIIILPLELLFFNEKVWTFGKEYVTPWWFLGLPLEEYLFYVIMVPFMMLMLKVVETFWTERSRAKDR
jgi:lycopene cyclase domain-containing protein